MRIGRLFGIEIRVDLSWFVIFALVAWSLSSNIGPFGTITENVNERRGLAVLSALLFFASVLLHELSHSLVARANGVPIRGITLFVFGGVSRFEGEPQTAPSAAWIAFVGPLTSLVLGGLFALAAGAFGEDHRLGVVSRYLASANIALGVFNLLPAFPLDGGRVLHAILWKRYGDRARATRVAVGVGAVLAWILIAGGLIMTFFGGVGGGLWLSFVGWFILQAGNAERFQTEAEAALRGHQVAEIAEPVDDAAVAPNATGAEALEKMTTSGRRALPVLLGDQLLGIVSLEELASARNELAQTYVTALMTRIEDLETLAPETNAQDGLKQLSRTRLDQLPVVDANGRLVGILTRDAVLRYIAFERDHAVAKVAERVGHGSAGGH